MTPWESEKAVSFAFLLSHFWFMMLNSSDNEQSISCYQFAISGLLSSVTIASDCSQTWHVHNLGIACKTELLREAKLE